MFFMNRLVLYILLVFIFACESSNDNNKRRLKEKQQYEMRELLQGCNKILLNIEKQDIKDFAKRHRLDIDDTGSGLYYNIKKHGEGKKAKKGMHATIEYRVRLLTGDAVYSSDEDGLKEFEIGRDDVVIGLHEGILLLNVGSEATFIIPPHLAYGFPGDGEKIPKRSTIVYDVKLVDLKYN